jgi:hypothetical protein
MSRSRVSLLAVVCLGCAVLAPGASAKTSFRPRVGGALGLAPTVKMENQSISDVASGEPTPVTYHGGSTMVGGVTVHLIFWSGGTHPFQGQPAGAPADYEGMIEQFFTDVAHDSGATSNVFSVEPQYASGTSPGAITPGDYNISYSSSNPDDLILDNNPYPSSGQCASPNNAAVCVTDAQVQAEVNRVVQSTPGTPRGLHNLWYVFLPPDVDECITAGVCGTNAFGGYHSVSDLGHGATIYALTIDPIIETTIGPGQDPEGYPDAETTIDIAAHETNEAMSDPEGVGYMDPNGFEMADKCEFGPQHGTPLGFAADGSPYNQVINGHQYLIQEMWSNDGDSQNPAPSCVQRTTLTSNPLPLPQVNLTQFGSTVTGNVGSDTSFGVQVLLKRMGASGPVTVAQGSTTSSHADGSWSVSLAPNAVGDDRDEVDVNYTGANAPQDDVILTGNGGNPFTESGWTGWTALDGGSEVTNDPTPNPFGVAGPSVTLSPCFQTGVLGATLDGSPIIGGAGETSPTDFCNTQTDAATVATPGISIGDPITASSNDNRAFSPPDAQDNTTGALVKLTVPAGEPDSISQFTSPLLFAPTGFPTCTADLEAQAVSCTGLVPHESYTLRDGGETASGAADDTGTLTEPLAVTGGDAVALDNAFRTLTTLHVAHLRVDITGEQTVLSGGTCEAGQYYAPPLSTAPTNASAGEPSAVAGGAALTGTICPLSGDATGLPSSPIVQTDQLSGGETTTEVPDVEDTSPIEAEVVYGGFTAVAESGLPGPLNSVIPTDATTRIALDITPAAGGPTVFSAGNVDTLNGVPVHALKPGTYTAQWALTDANGDTRLVTTRFVEERGLSSHHRHVSRGPMSRISCTSVRHNRVKCTVTFPKARKTKGTVRILIAHGKRIAALGHARVTHGQASVTMRELHRITAGRWTVTLVLSQTGKAVVTETTTERMR